MEFLLEEELSSINLCALHCELRNTEQLLKSLGLFCFKVGTLDECNNELSKYGPENFNKQITVKLKEGQETTVERHNIQVSSFSGLCGGIMHVGRQVSAQNKVCFSYAMSYKLLLLRRVLGE